ncbi:hypothetical protein COO72_05455 [Bifidobacterium callitrichos]|nr:hypothetical protein COO72_05455 [Bifidobacterium callitrichos]
MGSCGGVDGFAGAGRLSASEEDEKRKVEGPALAGFRWVPVAPAWRASRVAGFGVSPSGVSGA